MSPEGGISMKIPSHTIALGSVNEGPVTRGEIGNTMILNRNRISLIKETKPVAPSERASIPSIFIEAFVTSSVKEEVKQEVKAKLMKAKQPETKPESPRLTEIMLPRALFVA